MAKRIITRICTYQIYKIVNKLSGKVYIGCTTVGFESRFLQHIRLARKFAKTSLQYAMAKHGVINFECLLVEAVFSLSDMLDAEKKHILAFNSLSPNGYNLTTGGDGAFTFSDDVKRRIGDASRGRIATLEAKANMSLAAKGKSKSKEHCESLAKARVGMKFSDSHLEAMSKARIGKKMKPRTKGLSEETKQKIREAALRQWSNPEALAHISKVRKGRVTTESAKLLIGEKSKLKWSDDEYRVSLISKMTTAQKAVAGETSKKMKAMWSDPEYRANRLKNIELKKIKVT